jgi:hypothetical protein
MQLDVFNQDAFSMHQLTATFIKRPYQPMMLGKLGLFQESGIRTTSLDVESYDGRLSLIQTSQRGAPAPDPLGSIKRTMRTFRAYHLERDAHVYADEVQGIRLFGSETELQAVQDIVNQRLDELRPMHEVTLEYHRANAIQGLNLDADGSSLLNLFTEFGVSQQTLDIALATTTTDVRGRLVAAKRLAEVELGAQVITGWLCFCDAAWFDAFVGHATVVDSFKYQEGQINRADLRETGFTFAGITFMEYRSAVNKPDSVGGSAAFIPANTAWLVPVTVPSIFITRFAPADYEETVNTMGLPLYAKNVPDPSGLNKYRRLNTQSNPICLCLRPRAVIKLTKS